MPPTVPAQGFQPLFAQEAALWVTLSQGGVAQGRPPEVPRAGPPASHSFAVPTAPRAGGRTMASMRAFDGPLPPLSLSLRLLASLSLRISGSLLFLNILPEPPGSRAGGAGQWERDRVLFSPRTIRAGKGWSQGLAASAPRALPPRPSGVPDMPAPFVGELPLRVGDPSCSVSPSRCPREHPARRPPPAPLPRITYSSFRSRRRVLRVSGPRVREQEETSGFPHPAGMGLPPLPQASASKVAQPQESQGQEAGTSALLTFRSPGAPVASRPLT